MKKGFTLLLLPALALALSACGTNGADSASESKYLAKANAEVQETYKKQCMSCHGTDLQGKMGGRSNIQTVGARQTRDEIKETIVNGRTRMVPFKNRLKPEQIDGLADWLSGLK